MNRERIIQNLKQIQSLIEDSLLELSALSKMEAGKREAQHLKVDLTEIDFDMNERAFIKKYGKGMSGPKKFVLILAYLVKGKVGQEKSLSEIENHWNKMTSLVRGKFNRFYSARAKENNWVDSKKTGFYQLTSDWKKIF